MDFLSALIKKRILITLNLQCPTTPLLELSDKQRPSEM